VSGLLTAAHGSVDLLPVKTCQERNRPINWKYLLTINCGQYFTTMLVQTGWVTAQPLLKNSVYFSWLSYLKIHTGMGLYWATIDHFNFNFYNILVMATVMHSIEWRRLHCYLECQLVLEAPVSRESGSRLGTSKKASICTVTSTTGDLTFFLIISLNLCIYLHICSLNSSRMSPYFPHRGGNMK